MNRTSRRAADGFTLVELVMVLLVIGILTAAAAPRYLDALARYRVQLAARRLVADLEMARRNAQQTSQSQQVSFSIAENNYSLPGMNDFDNRSGDYLVELDEEISSTRISSISITAPHVVTFNLYGQPDKTGDITLQSGTAQRTVSIDSYGKISIL